MSHQSAAVLELERQTALRSRAAARLSGAAADKGYMASAADALAVLHDLASSPNTAPDALALLHEMQVYQVELDMQAQDLHESFSEMETALRRQREIYDHQPVGSFTIDTQSVLQELNQTGAAMLGMTGHDALGMRLEAFFSADSASRFRSAVANHDPLAGPAGCLLLMCPHGQPVRQVWARVSADPAANRYLVALMDVGEAAWPSAPGPARHAD